MQRRRKARETVVQMLFQIDINPDVDDRAVRAMIDDQLRDVESRRFAWELFIGTFERRAMIDAKIQAVAVNWRLERMATTDRNILRLGAYELLFTDTPPRVCIDEAIEIAKRFGDPNSSQFVNGILDRLFNEAEESPTPEKREGETPAEP